jgi:hypothetical protein
MGNRRAYCDRMESTVRDFCALFETLAAEAGGQTTRARARYAVHVEAFRPRRDDAERALAALRSGDGDWIRRKQEAEKSVSDLQNVVARAARQIGSRTSRQRLP